MLRLAFMGSPTFSVATLQALHEAGHEIAAVYSQPPKARGRRGLELQPTPVAEAAEKLGIPVRTPKSLRPIEEQEAFRALRLDAAVVVAYGLILPPPILEAPRLGCLNGHASLLPRWRGAAPIQRAIMAGDHETGVGVMRMEEGLDTGPVSLERRIAIGENETAGQLHDRLMGFCAGLMVEALAELARGTLRFSPQPDDGVTYAAKIAKGEARVDFSRPAAELHNHIRALSPAPGAWCEFNGPAEPERLKLLRSERADGQGAPPGKILDERLTVACGEGALRLLELQRAGGRPISADEFLRGARLRPGDRLG
ncbi:MAG TPA: methionyl-tRNA formyltransferase [Mesorhizobium sp.]|jgi:methionyl-tRNA formyltransferase|nr:methionyl-tRNA formyltransferase [Mesorhizobium sp.]